jgi:hypothetical protein
LKRHIEELHSEQQQKDKQHEYEISVLEDNKRHLEQINQTLRDDLLVINEQYKLEAEAQAQAYEDQLVEVTERLTPRKKRTEDETSVEILKLNRELRSAIGELKSIVKLVKSQDPHTSNVSVVEAPENEQEDKTTISTAIRNVISLRKTIDVLRSITADQYIHHMGDDDNEQCATQ